MAVDDVVADVGDTNTILTFQPGAGVEVMILCAGADAQSAVSPTQYDGTNEAGVFTQQTENITNWGNLKFGITNTNYLRIPALGVGFSGCYSGIQTK